MTDPPGTTPLYSDMAETLGAIVQAIRKGDWEEVTFDEKYDHVNGKQEFTIVLRGRIPDGA